MKLLAGYVGRTVLGAMLLVLALLPLPAARTVALLLLVLLLVLLVALLAFLLIALLFVRHNVPPISLMIGARTQAPHAPHPAPIILQPAPTMTASVSITFGPGVGRAVCSWSCIIKLLPF